MRSLADCIEKYGKNLDADSIETLNQRSKKFLGDKYVKTGHEADNMSVVKFIDDLVSERKKVFKDLNIVDPQDTEGYQGVKDKNPYKLTGKELLNSKVADKKAKSTNKESLTVEKEPWEMSQRDFVEKNKEINKKWQKTHEGPSKFGDFKEQADYKKYQDDYKNGVMEDPKDFYERSMHKSEVKQAIDQGKIKSHPDYPELSKARQTEYKDWFVNYTEQPNTGRTTETKHFSSLKSAKEFAKGKHGYITKTSDGASDFNAKDKGSTDVVEYFGEFEPSAQEVQNIKNITGNKPVAKPKIEPESKDITPKTSKAFKSKGAATMGIIKEKAQNTHDAVKVDGGWIGREREVPVIEPSAYDQKKEDRADRFRDNAAKARDRSDKAYGQSKSISDMIPMGQPILVGHHSEGRARRDQDKIWNKMGKSVEESKKADYYENKASSAENNTSISSDDSNAVIKLKEKLRLAEQSQELMKAVNKIIRNKKMSEAEKIKEIVKSTGWKEGSVKGLINPAESWRSVGFPSYKLTNNNANIKRMKDRVKSLERHANDVTSEVEFEGGTITDNVEDNRVQIFHDVKPSDEVRKELKSNGFKWARSVGAWQRQRNNYVLDIAKRITGIKEKPVESKPKVEKSETKAIPYGPDVFDTLKKAEPYETIKSKLDEKQFITRIKKDLKGTIETWKIDDAINQINSKKRGNKIVFLSPESLIRQMVDSKDVRMPTNEEKHPKKPKVEPKEPYEKVYTIDRKLTGKTLKRQKNTILEAIDDAIENAPTANPDAKITFSGGLKSMEIAMDGKMTTARLTHKKNEGWFLSAEGFKSTRDGLSLKEAKHHAESFLKGETTGEGMIIFKNKNGKTPYETRIENNRYNLRNYRDKVKKSKGVNFAMIDSKPEMLLS